VPRALSCGGRGAGAAGVKVLTVVGARPQFIKAAAVSRTLRRDHVEVLLHTGQHYDDGLSAQFFRQLNLPKPDYELGVGSATHGKQTARMLDGIEDVILHERPDAVLVYGDTNSTLAGALAAAKLQVPVWHVEAGLRSFNRRMPEEQNRILTDHLSTLLFCPSTHAAENLAREGVTAGVHVVGDVMAEAVRQFAPNEERAAALIAQYSVTPRDFIVATIHRAENTDDSDRLRRIVFALERLDERVVLPAHPRLHDALLRASVVPPPNVTLVAPAGYEQMLALVRTARVVLTDSGGLQKEAYWLGVPCVTLRDETEWVETLQAGWNRLVGADSQRIVDAVRHIQRPSSRAPLYGEGDVVERLCEVLASQVGGAVRA
jgi:UDP-GlcNAc3NAcA epimerase